MDTTLRRMTEEAADLHLSLDCEDSVVKSQTLHLLLPPEKCVAQETAFLSRTKLTAVAESILKNRSLKNLYLEGNQIVSLPDSMFTSLPNLVWLDLRNNHISLLPMKIGFHRSLKTLLLEGNPISELPPELGNVMTLKALNLRNCPVRFPPPAIVHAGVQSILQFLRSAVQAERSVVHVWKSHADAEMPLVEKLQLSELVGSSMDLCEEEEEGGEAADEDELHKFRDLKHRMILMDRAELDYDDGEPIVPSAQQPRAAAAAQGDENREPKLLAIVQREKKEITRADIIPARNSFDIQHGLRSEERRLAAIKELKEKQAILEQKRKDQEFLQEWRKHTKAMQDRKVLELKKERREKHRREEHSETRHAGHNPTQRIQKSFMSQKELEESRAARDLELELRIQSHVQMMQERCRHPAIGTTEEQITAAKQDMEETKKLQAELLERKQTRDVM